MFAPLNFAKEPAEIVVSLIALLSPRSLFYGSDATSPPTTEPKSKKRHSMTVIYALSVLRGKYIKDIRRGLTTMLRTFRVVICLMEDSDGLRHLYQLVRPVDDTLISIADEEIISILYGIKRLSGRLNHEDAFTSLILEFHSLIESMPTLGEIGFDNRCPSARPSPAFEGNTPANHEAGVEARAATDSSPKETMQSLNSFELSYRILRALMIMLEAIEMNEFWSKMDGMRSLFGPHCTTQFTTYLNIHPGILNYS